MRRLALFDIDGTLTATNAVDDECYLRAVAEVLGLEAGTLEWSNAPHVTDAGILRWLCETKCGRPLLDGETASTHDRFLSLLRSALGDTPARFNEVSGAATALRELPGAGWDVALATGGWEQSARLKLAAIGVGDDDLVLASANDAPTRTEIMTMAIERATRRGGEPFDRVVSLGDGVWDVRAAADLEVPFVGIGTGAKAEALRAAGAAIVLPDLNPLDAVRAALDRATVPRS